MLNVLVKKVSFEPSHMKIRNGQMPRTQFNLYKYVSKSRIHNSYQFYVANTLCIFLDCQFAFCACLCVWHCATYLYKSQKLLLTGQPGTLNTLKLTEHRGQSGAGVD